VCSGEPESLAAEHERTGPEEPEQGESERVTAVGEKQRATAERDQQAQRRRHQHRYLDLSVVHGPDDATRGDATSSPAKLANAPDMLDAERGMTRLGERTDRGYSVRSAMSVLRRND
jgi:hypothetical protein